MILKDRKQILIAFIIIIVLFVLSIIIALFLKPRNNVEKSKDGLSVSFDSTNVITINNKLPISDALGKKIEDSDNKQGFVDINISNFNLEDVDYQIYLTKEKVNSNMIEDNYIKFYLTDEVSNPLSGFDKNMIPSFNDFLILKDKPASKLLYEGTISGKSTNKLSLRVWVSDSYVLSDIDEEFSVKINVRVK